MGISNLIALLSGVALFLFGMTLMGDGLKKVAGNKLELVLYICAEWMPHAAFKVQTGLHSIIAT